MDESRFLTEAQMQGALQRLQTKYAGTDYEVRLASEHTSIREGLDEIAAALIRLEANSASELLLHLRDETSAWAARPPAIDADEEEAAVMDIEKAIRRIEAGLDGEEGEALIRQILDELHLVPVKYPWTKKRRR